MDGFKNSAFQYVVHQVEVYGLILVDLSGNIVSWNKGAHQLLGYEENDVLGRHFELFFTPEDRTRNVPREEMTTALATGYCYDDRWHLRKDLTRLYVNGGLCLLRGSGGDPFGFVKIIRDQTEKREYVEKIEDLNSKLLAAHTKLEEYATSLEYKVRERTEELNQRNAELQDFCYSIAHDLRAPLRSIQAMSQVVIEDYETVLDSKGLEHLNRISKAGRQLDQLTIDLLAYTRFTRETITLTTVELEQATDEVLHGMDHTIKLKGGTVIVRKPLPKVWGQNAFIVQIIGNFISNALKFVSPDRPPQVTIWTEAKAGRVRINVQDNGIGISSEYLEKIFGLFERLHSPDAFEGTGVGLAIAKKAAQRMSGDVGVSSEVGKGSTFWLELGSPE
jgi:PAS domain S-box-containing protein